MGGKTLALSLFWRRSLRFGSFPYRRNRRCSSAESFCGFISVWLWDAIETYVNVDFVLLERIHCGISGGLKERREVQRTRIYLFVCLSDREMILVTRGGRSVTLRVVEGPELSTLLYVSQDSSVRRKFLVEI